MLNTKIIASEVCNLTDARYFAAWGVDYMAFDCNPSSLNYVSEAALAEIRTWVEGPGILGILNSDLDANKICQDLSLNGTVTNELSDGGAEMIHFQIIPFGLLDQSSLQNLIIKIDNQEQLDIVLSRSSQLENCFLDLEPTISVVKEIIATGKLGIVLKGGAEEKVGFKSYEHYNDLYELFMD